MVCYNPYITGQYNPCIIPYITQPTRFFSSLNGKLQITSPKTDVISPAHPRFGVDDFPNFSLESLIFRFQILLFQDSRVYVKSSFWEIFVCLKDFC